MIFDGSLSSLLAAAPVESMRCPTKQQASRVSRARMNLPWKKLVVLKGFYGLGLANTPFLYNLVSVCPLPRLRSFHLHSV